MRRIMIAFILLVGCTGGQHYTNIDASGGDDIDANVPPIDSDDGVPDAMPADAMPEGTWSTPEKLLLSTTVSEDFPSASPNGLELFFTSYPTGSTIPDLFYVSRAATADAWGTTRTAIAAINTTQTEAETSVSPDGLEIVFRRGAGDLYSVRRTSLVASWGTPAATGIAGDRPNLLGDGLTMYYRDGDCVPSTVSCRTKVTRATTTSAWGSPVVESFPAGGYQTQQVSRDGLRVLLSSPSTTTVAPVAIARRDSMGDSWGAVEPISELALYTTIKSAYWNFNETEMYIGFTQGTDGDIYISHLVF